MSFQLNESLTLLQMELVAKRFFEFLSDMDIEKGFNPPVIKDISENHLGTEKHQTLIAIYRAFFVLINRSLVLKKDFVNLGFVEEHSAIVEMNGLVFNLLGAMNHLRQVGNEDILIYFLKGERGRNIIYYLLSLHFIHKKDWENTNLLDTWIQDLVAHATTEEKQFLKFYQQLFKEEIVLDSLTTEHLMDSEIYLFKDFDPHHYVVALFAIEEKLKSFPANPTNIPMYFYKYLKIKLAFDFFDCLSRCDEKLDAYEKFTNLLQKYQFLPDAFSENFQLCGRLAPVHWLLAYMEYHSLNLSFYCSKDYLPEQTIRLNHLCWRLYLVLNEDLAFQPFFQNAFSVLNFLSHGHIPNHPMHRSKFFDATFKLFTNDKCYQEEYLNLMARSSYILSYMFLCEGRGNQAVKMLTCLLSYNQMTKKKLLGDKTQHFIELQNLLKFISFHNEKFSLEDEIKLYYLSISRKELIIKDFNPKYCFKDFREFSVLLKTLLLNKVSHLSPQLKLMPQDENLFAFQQYIYSVAKLLNASEAEFKLLESQLKKDEIDFDVFDDIKTVSAVSMFQDSRKFIHKTSIPQAVRDIYGLLYEFNKLNNEEHQTHLWLFGGQVRQLYMTDEVKPDADYDLKAWKLDLSGFFEFLQQKNYRHGQLVEAQVPVIRLRIPDEMGLIDVDIQSFGDDDLTVDKALQIELRRCDFTISSAYLEINSDKQFEIRGFNKAIQCLNKKMITLNNADAISKDPLILLRLVHLCLSDAELKISHSLSEILKSGESQKALEIFLQDDTHCRQFVTQLKKSLMKVHSRETMVNLMNEFDFFEIWTGLGFSEIKQGIQHLPALDEKLKLSIPLQLVEYLYLYQSMKLESFEKMQATVLYRVSRCFSPVERLFFRYIDHILWGIEIKDFVIAPDILLLKDYVQNTHFSKILQESPIPAACNH